MVIKISGLSWNGEFEVYGKTVYTFVYASDTKEKAKELGYETSETPVQMKNKSYTIGVIVAERYVKEYPSFYMEIYKCIAQEATKRGSMTILEVAGEKKEKLEQDFNTFQDIDVSGIIIIGEMNRDYVNKVKKFHNLPVVCVDFYDVAEDIDYIDSYDIGDEIFYSGTFYYDGDDDSSGTHYFSISDGYLE